MMSRGLAPMLFATAMAATLLGCGSDDNARFGQPDVLPPRSGAVSTGVTTTGGGGGGGAGPSYICDPMATMPATCPTYAVDIRPYIESDCAFSGCHLDGMNALPNFDGANSHATLSGWLDDTSTYQYFDSASPEASWFLCNLDFPNQMGPVPGSKMPIGAPPDAATRQLLGEWVVCGMQDD